MKLNLRPGSRVLNQQKLINRVLSRLMVRAADAHRRTRVASQAEFKRRFQARRDREGDEL